MSCKHWPFLCAVLSATDSLSPIPSTDSPTNCSSLFKTHASLLYNLLSSTCPPGSQEVPISIFFNILFFICRQRGRKRGRETSMCACLSHSPLGTQPATWACALTGNPTRDPLVRSPELNSLSHTSQGPISIFTALHTPLCYTKFDTMKPLSVFLQCTVCSMGTHAIFLIINYCKHI